MRIKSTVIYALITAIMATSLASVAGPAAATSSPNPAPWPAARSDAILSLVGAHGAEGPVDVPLPMDRTSSGACPSSHPLALIVRAQTLQELEYLDDIDACTNFSQTQTWLNNRSDLVWVPSILPSGGYTSGLNLSATTFMAALQVTKAIIVPGDAVIVKAPPSQVEWAFDLPMSATWEGRNYLAGWAIDSGLAWAFGNRRTKVGATVATCLLLARNAVSLRRDLIADNSIGASTIVGNVLSTGVLAGTCGKSLTSVADDYNVRTPSFWKDMTSLDLTRLRSVDVLMARMQRLQRFLTLLTLG